MSIYKRGDVWWIDVRVGGGKRRVRKSTGCTDKTQARIVEQTAIALNRGLTTRAKARAIIDAVAPDEGLRLEDAAKCYEQFARDEGVTLAKHEWQTRISAIYRAAAWLIDNTRAVTVDDVTDEAAWQFATNYAKERGISAKSRNNLVGNLRTAWEMLIKHGKATINPWTRARAIRKADEETHGRAFTPDETERIIAAAREIGCDWEGVVIVALYTGLRKRDVETLRWSEVDVDRGVITRTPGKTARHGIAVTIPMHAEVVRVIRAAAARAKIGEQYVFAWRAHHPMTSHPVAGDHYFPEVLARAGIVEREGEHITFHSLRHTFITRLAEAGVAQDVRMRLAGHTNAATSNLYTHDDANARAAIDAL